MTKTTKRILMALCAVVGSAIVFVYGVLFTPVTPANHLFYLRPGVSKEHVISALHQEGFIRFPRLFNLYAYFSHRGSLKAGEYEFPKGSSPLTIWRQLTSGTGFYFRAFTIIPGWTFKQLRLSLTTNPWLKHNISHLSDAEIMKLLGSASVSPEGLFYPETYFFTRGDNDQRLLQRAYTLMQTKLNQAYVTKDASLPYRNAYDALIAASLIEKEGRIDKERSVIASVIINRLNKDMVLQIDATIIYALGDQYLGSIYKNDLKINSAYNTYLNKGLPPTPIAIPGWPSIFAALHPAHTNYFYYVAKQDGSHHFSETLIEHQQAVQAIRSMQQTNNAGLAPETVSMH